MCCEKYKDIALLYLYNELEEQIGKEFLEHLSSCQKCQQELALLKKTQEAVHSIPLDDVDPSLIEDILEQAQSSGCWLEKLKSLLAHARQMIHPMPRIAWIGTAVVSVIFLLLFWYISPFESGTRINKTHVLQWNASLDEEFDAIEKEITLLMADGDHLYGNDPDAELFENSIKVRLQEIENDILSLLQQTDEQTF